MPAAEKDVLLAVSVSFLLVLLALASSSLITPEWPHAHIKMHINIIRTQLLTVILAQLLIYIYILFRLLIYPVPIWRVWGTSLTQIYKAD